MKRAILLAIMLFVPLAALGQIQNPSIVTVATAPSGACTSGLPNQQVITTGTQYSCQNGTWGIVGGGGSGVTSVTGTANQIDVANGTTTPVVSLDPNIILPGATGGAPASGGINAASQYEINGVPLGNQTGISCLGTNTRGVANGISYQQCYAGATYDVRANACLADAAASANGNSTGICDATGEPSSGQSCNAQITVGDGTHPVKWLVGPGLFCAVTLTGGTSYAVLQKSESRIDCVGVQEAGCTFVNYSSANGPYALYGVTGTGYFYMNGVLFKNNHGSTMASGHIGIINDGYDGSTWQNNQWWDSATSNPSNTAAVLIQPGTGCCHANFINNTFDSDWGEPALDIEVTGANQFNAINFHDNTFNSHNTGAVATTNPAILCHDSNPGLRTVISFTGVTYMEVYDPTAEFIQDNGCRALEFTGVLEAYPTGGTGITAPIINVTNLFDTTLNVGNVVAYQGSGTNPWTYPATVVEQNNTTSDCGAPPCAVAVTDSAGNSPGYHSRTSQFNNVTVGGNLIVKGTVAGSFGNGQITFATPALALTSTVYTSFGAGLTSATEANTYTTAPQATTVSSFSVYVGTAPGAGNSLVFTVRDCSGGGACTPAATSVACTIATTAQTCTAATTFNVAQGDYLDIQITPSGIVSVTPTITVTAQLGGGGGQVAAATCSIFSQGVISGTLPFSANTTKLFQFQLPCNITTSGVTYQLGTGDNTANLYNLGIFCAQAVCGTFTSGQVVVALGATPGTTFAPSSNHFSLSWSTPQTLLAGVSYAFGMTTNCASSCAVLSGAGDVGTAIGGTTSGTTSGAVFTSLTIPTTSYAFANPFPAFILH